jgi:hypothetical protein
MKFLVGAFQRVDDLLVLAGAERGDDDGLGFTAGEQGRTVGTRQDADFEDDRTHGREIAAVDAALGLEDVAADDFGFQLLEDRADLRTVLRVVFAFGPVAIMALDLGLAASMAFWRSGLVGDLVGLGRSSPTMP